MKSALKTSPLKIWSRSSETGVPLSCHNGLACPPEVGRPVVHQAAPTLEEITAGVGRLGGVLYRMGERGLDHFAGCARPFRGPVPEA